MTETMNRKGTINGMGMLDLTGIKSAEDLNMSEIKGVGMILVPEHLHAKLMEIPMEGVGTILPVPTGESVVLRTGQLTMKGDALAHAAEGKDTLVLVGQVLFTSPVTEIGYKNLIICGQLMAPESSRQTLEAATSKLVGQTLYYGGETPRVFVGQETFTPEFLQMFDKPTAFILVGQYAFEEGVSTELLKQSIEQITLAGEIKAPKSLVPILQFLTVQKNGTITSTEANE